MKEKRSVLICCDLLCISISVTSSKLVDLGLIVILKPIVFFLVFDERRNPLVNIFVLFLIEKSAS